MKNKKSHDVGFWFPVALWAGVIFGFSSIEVHPASQIVWQDFIIKKTAHVIEYAVFFVLLYRSLHNTTRLSKLAIAWIAMAVVILYGITDEYHQSFTPGREPKARDVVFDTIGGGLAWLGLWKYLPKLPARLKNLAESLQVA